METPLPVPSGNLIGCPDCDLLISYQPPRMSYDTRCPRCHALLKKSRDNSASRTLAMSLSGLFLFIPACFLPLIELNILGYPGRCTMVKGVAQMIRDGYVGMSLLVLFCSIVVPLCIQMLLFYLSLCVKISWYPASFRSVLVVYQHLLEWSMLDVYMLGILIALIKMNDYGYVFSGSGLYCFIGVMILANLSMLSFDTGLAWDNLEAKSS